MEKALNLDMCPECGSDEVYYENPNTGCGGYACMDCGYEYPKASEEMKKHEGSKSCGLTGVKWTKRKSRAKIARTSRKRNRRGREYGKGKNDQKVF
ncbi:MAG: hypothetical protein APF81_27455 [Desulfosporosinus sp. BRH_c37]|nr:MAG: hypothetical protein APF81_27455 [Desulfosporosinus sp. BRH_c37]